MYIIKNTLKNVIRNKGKSIWYLWKEWSWKVDVDVSDRWS